MLGLDGGAELEAKHAASGHSGSNTDGGHVHVDSTGNDDTMRFVMVSSGAYVGTKDLDVDDMSW